MRRIQRMSQLVRHCPWGQIKRVEVDPALFLKIIPPFFIKENRVQHWSVASIKKRTGHRIELIDRRGEHLFLRRFG